MSKKVAINKIEEPKQVKQSNGFAALCYDSDSEEEKNTSTHPNVVQEISWKDIIVGKSDDTEPVSKPKDTEPFWSVMYEPGTSYDQQPRVIKKCWSNWSDWSDDSEYEEKYQPGVETDQDDFIDNWY